jgi:hypothetical protein
MLLLRGLAMNKKGLHLQAFGYGVSSSSLNYKYPTFWAKEIIELP